jgi:hypothetical protein
MVFTNNERCSVPCKARQNRQHTYQFANRPDKKRGFHIGGECFMKPIRNNEIKNKEEAKHQTCLKTFKESQETRTSSIAYNSTFVSMKEPVKLRASLRLKAAISPRLRSKIYLQ